MEVTNRSFFVIVPFFPNGIKKDVKGGLSPKFHSCCLVAYLVNLMERMDSNIDLLWGENRFRTLTQNLLFAFMFPFIWAKRYLGLFCFIWKLLKSGNTTTLCCNSIWICLRNFICGNLIWIRIYLY